MLLYTFAAAGSKPELPRQLVWSGLPRHALQGPRASIIEDSVKCDYCKQVYGKPREKMSDFQMETIYSVVTILDPR